MNKYNNGKIYKLVCNNTGLIYYGSTIQTLPKRIYEHKRCKDCTSREIIKNENFEIILVELYKCNSKIELEQRERYYIENNECINKKIPTRTKKEYYEKNKEIFKERHNEYRKEYRLNNKEKANEYAKKYYLLNIEKCKEYYKEYNKKIRN
jgi:hypothetical protein